MTRCCEKCRFYHANPPNAVPGHITFSGDGIHGGGECRRHPPRRESEYALSRFPLVSDDWWCGEFLAAEGVVDGL